jgi:hypothetical protein
LTTFIEHIFIFFNAEERFILNWSLYELKVV